MVVMLPPSLMRLGPVNVSVPICGTPRTFVPMDPFRTMLPVFVKVRVSVLAATSQEPPNVRAPVLELSVSAVGVCSTAPVILIAPPAVVILPLEPEKLMAVPAV